MLPKFWLFSLTIWLIFSITWLWQACARKQRCLSSTFHYVLLYYCRHGWLTHPNRLIDINTYMFLTFYCFLVLQQYLHACMPLTFVENSYSPPILASLYLWFSTFLMFRPFNRDPHVVVISKYKIIFIATS